MSRSQHIKEAFERISKAIAMRPSVGQGTARTKVSLSKPRSDF